MNDGSSARRALPHRSSGMQRVTVVLSGRILHRRSAVFTSAGVHPSALTNGNRGAYRRAMPKTIHAVLALVLLGSAETHAAARFVVGAAAADITPPLAAEAASNPAD